VGPESAAAGRSGEDRLAREIEHGRKIAGNAETVWFWENFLHPSIPQGWVERGLAVSRALERVPLAREIAGSMLMRARRA
jgi:hypothetical protein